MRELLQIAMRPEIISLAGGLPAPDTFDVGGYVALLRRLRDQQEEVVHAPEFDRALEASLGSAIPVAREIPLVVTEGNYLLLTEPPWDGVRELLDEAWFVHLADAERQRRMVARHLQYGHDRADAEARTHGNDERNARLVNAAPNRPDLWIEQVP